MHKINSTHKFILKAKQIFDSHDLKDHAHFLRKPTQIFFDQLLTSTNLYQHAKSWPISSFCSRYMVDLKSFNLIGHNYFGPCSWVLIVVPPPLELIFGKFSNPSYLIKKPPPHLQLNFLGIKFWLFTCSSFYFLCTHSCFIILEHFRKVNWIHFSII